MADLQDPTELVEWLGENITESGWEPLREQVEAAGHPQLVAWLDSMEESERERYLLDPDGRSEVVAWLSESANGAALPQDPQPAAAGPEQTWDEYRQV